MKQPYLRLRRFCRKICSVASGIAESPALIEVEMAQNDLMCMSPSMGSASFP